MAATEPKGHVQHAGMWVLPDALVISLEFADKLGAMLKLLAVARAVFG